MSGNKYTFIYLFIYKCQKDTQKSGGTVHLRNCSGARYPVDEDPEFSLLHLQMALLPSRLDLALLDSGSGKSF